MPFIIGERRKIIGEKGLEGLKDIQVGDRCFVYYYPMVDRWKANPRWTTAHEIYKEMRKKLDNAGYSWDYLSPDDATAYELAWQVFFQLYVIPYELKKREENGDI